MKLNEVTDYGRDEADDVDFEHAIALAAVYDIDKFIHKVQDRETVRLLTKHKNSFIKNALIDLREMIESSHETWDYGQVLSPPDSQAPQVEYRGARQDRLPRRLE